MASEGEDPSSDAMKNLLMKGDQNADQFRRDILGTGTSTTPSEGNGGSYLSYIKSKYGDRESTGTDDTEKSIRSAWQKDFEESKLNFILGKSTGDNGDVDNNKIPAEEQEDSDDDDGVQAMKLPPHQISGGDFTETDVEVQVDNFVLGDEDEDDDHGEAVYIGQYVPSGIKYHISEPATAESNKKAAAPDLRSGFEPIISDDDDDRIEVVDFADVDITDRILGAITAEEEEEFELEEDDDDDTDSDTAAPRIKEGGNVFNLPVENMDIKAVDANSHIRTNADAFLEYYMKNIHDVQEAAAAGGSVGDIEDLDCEDDED